MTPPIGIFLVDDHPIILQAVKSLLECEEDFKVVGEADSGQNAINRVPLARPDVVLLDWRMPGMLAGEVCRRLKLLAPEIKVLIFTFQMDQEIFLEATAAGADGYTLKGAFFEKLVENIRAVASGKLCF